MSDPTIFILALFGITFGGALLLMGKHALLAQDSFLRIYNKWQKSGKIGVKPYDLEYFGGGNKLKALGAILVATGIFIITSIIAILLERLR